MNLHRTVTLALLGWYLIAPPIKAGFDPIPLTDTPLAKWPIISSWRTQPECEDALKAWRHKAATTYVNARDYSPSAKAKALWLRADGEQARYSICVETDDLRLKSEAPK